MYKKAIFALSNFLLLAACNAEDTEETPNQTSESPDEKMEQMKKMIQQLNQFPRQFRCKWLNHQIEQFFYVSLKRGH